MLSCVLEIEVQEVKSTDESLTTAHMVLSKHVASLVEDNQALD